MEWDGGGSGWGCGLSQLLEPTLAAAPNDEPPVALLLRTLFPEGKECSSRLLELKFSVAEVDGVFLSSIWKRRIGWVEIEVKSTYSIVYTISIPLPLG